MQLEFSRTSDSPFALAKVGVRALNFSQPRAMKPNPPSSPDGSALPPRHRPLLGNLSKDTTEQDLWAFDAIDPQQDYRTEAPPNPPGPELPVARNPRQMKRHQPVELPPAKSAKPGEAPANVRPNSRKNRPEAQAGSTSRHSKPGSEFDDLDRWDEPAPPPDSQISQGTRTTPALAPPPATAETLAPVTPPADSQDEFSPPVRDHATPESPRPRLNLTTLERVGLVALSMLLVLGGSMFFLNTISRLPTGSGRVKANDFPIRGSQLTIVAADSFWRAPKAADTARRGTQLIPVVDLTTSGGPGAIRVFFRNSDGEVIGDAVTHSLKSGGKLQIAATAGFEDVGMHAAYRTGSNKPWTIEVLEAATENSPGQEFTKLFEMNVSAARR